MIYKILPHLNFLFAPINKIYINLYIYINHMMMMMMMILVLLSLHCTTEEIDSECLGICQGLAKTYNLDLMTKLHVAVVL